MLRYSKPTVIAPISLKGTWLYSDSKGWVSRQSYSLKRRFFKENHNRSTCCHSDSGSSTNHISWNFNLLSRAYYQITSAPYPKWYKKKKKKKNHRLIAQWSHCLVCQWKPLTLGHGVSLQITFHSSSWSSIKYSLSLFGFFLWLIPLRGNNGILCSVDDVTCTCCSISTSIYICCH